MLASKKAGDLGIGDTVPWNTAALGKHVWAVSSKQNNFWVKWVTQYMWKVRAGGHTNHLRTALVLEEVKER